MIARLQPSLELYRGDASLPEVTEEAAPSYELEHEIGSQRYRDDDDQQPPEGSGSRRDTTDDICEEVAESDPGSGPQQGARRGVEEKSFDAEWGRPPRVRRRAGSHRVETWPVRDAERHA